MAEGFEGARLARPARALRLPLYADIVLLAQCRGRLLCQAVQATFEAWRLPIRRRSPGSHQSTPRRNKPGAKALHMDRGPGQNHRRRQTRAPSVRFHPTSCADVSSPNPEAVGARKYILLIKVLRTQIRSRTRLVREPRPDAIPPWNALAVASTTQSSFSRR